MTQPSPNHNTVLPGMTQNPNVTYSGLPPKSNEFFRGPPFHGI